MLRLTARAKINWTLDILGRRADGYHRMDMLMGSVSLADTLWMERADKLTLEIEGAGELRADESNLVWRAALALAERAGCRPGARIRLQKRIPMGAGMGGGSADAAAALVGLNRLWDARLPEETLLELGLALGADVPFLLVGGLARVGGIGEAIARLTPVRRYELVMVQPCAPLSTREVFADYDARPPARRPDTDAAQRALLTGDLPLLAAAMDNVLAPVSRAKRPAIREAEAALRESGAICAQMTGSGSAVVGLFADAEAADAARETLRTIYPRCERMHTAAESVSCAEEPPGDAE